MLVANNLRSCIYNISIAHQMRDRMETAALIMEFPDEVRQ